MAAAQDDIPEHLQCPICFEIPKAKVFQCRDGHIICEECYSQLEDCPQCRFPFDTNPIRNRAVEAMLSQLKPEKKNPPKRHKTPPRPPVKRKLQQNSILFARQTNQQSFSFIRLTSGFGRVHLSGNSILKTFGNGNRGEIINNSNLKVDSQNSHLNLTNNSNVKIDIKDSTIKAELNSNVKINGEEIEAELVENSNCKFEGRRSEWKCSSNSNCKFDGDDSDITAHDNSNVNVFGNGNIIIAFNNSNLRATGDDIFLSIKNTSNHSIHPSRRSNRHGEGINSLAISSQPFFSGMSSCHFDIGYVSEADIDGDNYKIGIFQFTLQRMAFSSPEVKYKLVFNYSGFRQNQIITQKVNGSEIKITGVKNGVKQSIFLKGKSIEEDSDNKTVFVVTSRASDSLPVTFCCAVIRFLLFAIFIFVLCIFFLGVKKFLMRIK